MTTTVVDMNTGIADTGTIPAVEDADQARLDAVLADLKAEGEAAEAGKGEETDKGATGETDKGTTGDGKGGDATGAEGEGEGDGKPGPTVPLAALTATRAKAQEERLARVALEAKLETLQRAADAGVEFSPAQMKALLGGKSVEEIAQEAEPEADPYDLIDAKELELVKKREDGDIDLVEYTTGLQALNKERRALDRQAQQQTAEVVETRGVEATIAERSRSIQSQFEVFKTGGPNGGALTNGQLHMVAPLARQATMNGMAEAFGEGVKYDDKNPEHRLFFQWNLALAADKNFGKGQGPVQQQTPGGKGAKPTVREAVTESPPGRKAAAVAAFNRRGNHPPELQQFTHGAETELGILERKLLTATTEEFEAIMAKNPALRDSLLN